ncbi:hypothetical protein, partial [Escherichia coli]|uniref:hypothetical protein n=1 Tax=Escherichia coli TaxID=562 RepID=UPI001BD49E14
PIFYPPSHPRLPAVVFFPSFFRRSTHAVCIPLKKALKRLFKFADKVHFVYTGYGVNTLPV